MFGGGGESSKVNAGEPMRTALGIVGVLLVLFGCVWFLQGINVLPGSFMTGQIRWAVYGGIAVTVGVILLGTAARKRRGALGS
jgi:hypothetical protein